LGLFRIVYGFLLLVSLLQFGPDLRVFFTDDGFLSRQSASAFWPGRFSVLSLLTEGWQVAIFWALSLVVAVLLMVGYRTRLSCALAFIAVISFQHRNPLILYGADVVLRLLAFWLIFTAAGDRFSVDSALRRARGQQVSGFGPAFPIRIMQLQIAWIYLATGLEKLAGQAWLDGTAAYYALQHAFYGRASVWPLPLVERLSRPATWGALGIELGFLPAVFLPLFQPYARLVAVIAAAMLHVGILLFMNVGNFPLIMLAALIPFLPPAAVHRLMRPGRSADPSRPAASQAAGMLASWRPVSMAALGCVAAASFATALPTNVIRHQLPAPISVRLDSIGLTQSWRLFAPNPTRTEAWIRAPGRLADGSLVDLVDQWGRPEPRDPRPLSESGSTEPRFSPLYTRWVKVHRHMSSDRYRLEYAQMYCRLRNHHIGPGESPLESLDLIYTRRTVPPPGTGPPRVRDQHLGFYRC
jgi:hypothetical protein